MRHFLLAALIYATSLFTWAQADPFTVAYTKSSGSTLSIYLAKEDGSQAVPIYSSKKSISYLNLAPNGGRLAFVEGYDLKVLSYTVSGSSVNVSSVATLDSTGVESPDFSADGSKILYVGGKRTTSDIRLIDAGGGTPSVLVAPASGIVHIQVAWLAAGSSYTFAHVQHSIAPFQLELRAATIVAPGSVTPGPLLLTNGAGADFSEIAYLDGARMKPNSILVTLNLPQGIRVVEFDVSNMSSRLEHVAGMRGRFSRDDSKIFYIDSTNAYVLSHLVGTGTSTRLTKRGSYGWVDPRP